jgi:hypothetical protein
VWGFFESHTKLCAEALHSCWLVFLFPDAFLLQSHLETGWNPPHILQIQGKIWQRLPPLSPHPLTLEGGSHLVGLCGV